MEEFRSSFIWWYFDYYDLSLDPCGYFGKDTERVMKVHIKLSGKNLEKEFLKFLFGIREYQTGYDVLANFDFEKVKEVGF